jgi:hypothetical protein
MTDALLPAIPISPRARAILKGLVRAGRVAGFVVVGNWIKAKARRGNEFYWIDANKGTLRRGIGLGEATELSAGFATTMAKLGA